jgi:hypothetical protein
LASTSVCRNGLRGGPELRAIPQLVYCSMQAYVISHVGLPTREFVVT